MSLTFIGIVVNPKVQRPVLAAYDGDEVLVYRLDEGIAYEGRGNYDPGGSDYSKPQIVSGYPRVHTPSGIQTKGEGYGTTLYTALCLGAHLDSEDLVDLDVYQEGDGISSDEAGRSSSATRWWDLAKQLGLATEQEGEEEEENVPLEVDASELDACGIAGQKRITYVNEVNVDLVETIKADVYTYDAAWSADLCVAELHFDAPSDQPSALRRAWQAIPKGDVVFDVNGEALAALDVRSLDAEALKLLRVLCRYDGVDEALVDAMRFRWEHNCDPSVPFKQQLLPFKKNAPEARLAREALGIAKELRQKLKWKRFAALP